MYNKLINKKKLKNWVIIYDFPNEKNLDNLNTAIQKAAKRFKIDVAEPGYIQLPKLNLKNKKALKLFIKEFNENEVLDQKKLPKIILYFVTGRTGNILYNESKLFY